MPIKVLTSTLVGMDSFCKDPISTMLQAENGTLAVLHQNTPVFYALTPQRLAQLIALESSMHNQNNILKNKDKLCNNSTPTFTSSNKFTMYPGWCPDEDFQRQAALWGILLSEPITETELAAFITYWQAEGCLFHHVQWQQKLARSVQMNRLAKKGHVRRYVTQKSNSDYDIPDGFRG